MRASMAAVSASREKAGGVGTQLVQACVHAFEQRAAAPGPPVLVGLLVDQPRLPERAVPLPGHAPREVVAARADGVDLVEGE